MPSHSRGLLVLAAFALLTCVPAEPPTDAGGARTEPAPATAMPLITLQAPPAIQATNAFYYYRDVEAAHAFYTGVLGFETVADYGFAKILRVAATSYLTLVDAAEGMHSAGEPKSVTLAIVTDQVEGWHEYLTAQGVTMRGAYNRQEGRPHDGFVAIDPEGYFLEFERFNLHPENTELLQHLGAVEPLGPARSPGSAADVGEAGPGASPAGGRPPKLTVQGTVLWLYYRDVSALQAFWERTLGIQLIVDQGWAKVYPASSTGYIGLVDGTRGLHQATEQKGVTVSFFTDDVDGWLERARQLGLELRTPRITDESGRVRVLVGYDPEGYFLEWDTFLGVEGNERLLRLLSGASSQ